MGSYVSQLRRRSANGEEVDSTASQSAYLYPPKNGCNFFAPHFIMGGERFETCQPEMYLFGDNLDINFLGGKPTPFPYAAPLPNEPVRALNSLINIRKESVRFVRVTPPVEEVTSNEPKKPSDGTNQAGDTVPLKSSSSDHHVSSSSMSKASSLLRRHSTLASSKSSHNSNSLPSSVSLPNKDSGKHSCSNNHKDCPETTDAVAPPEYHYNIEFTFDSDVAVQIVIHYFCTEEITQTGVYYTPREPSMSSETVVFKRGVGQTFSQPSHIFSPFKHNEVDLIYRAFDENGFFDHRVPFPVVIQAVALEGDEPRQSHSLIAVVEKNQNGSYGLKPFIQKMFIDGLCYLIQEIYGIENKTVPTVKLADQYVSPEDEFEDSASECVVCLSDPRDTLILPCRHLCLCNACADSLRYQANNCPICRSPFRALLQIRAVRKIESIAPSAPAAHVNHSSSTGPIPIQRNTSSTIQNSLCSNNVPSDVPDIPQGYQSLPLMEALHGPSVAPYPAVYSIDKTPVSVRKSHRRDKTRGIMVNPVPIVPGISSSPSNVPCALEMASYTRHGISPTAPSDVSGRPMQHQIHITLPSIPSMTVQRTASLNSFPDKYSVTPPQPAPADWKVPVTRISRKTSDPEDPESSSSASSSTVPQETTRLLPRAVDAVQPLDAIASLPLMRRPSELNHALMQRKESYSDASNVDGCVSPKLMDRESLSLSSSSSFPIISSDQSFRGASNAIISTVVINDSDLTLNTRDYQEASNASQVDDDYKVS